MASQSPGIAPDAGQLADRSSYLQGWAALSELVDLGTSWSGHERNCAFLNRGDAGFLAVSAISGLDFDDDGRACLSTDLDGDGDLDLVFKNRSAPQLRFVQNQFAGGAALTIRLRDAGPNRDAIGARVEVVADGRRMLRCVSAGDGYLGQASRWLHFGCAGAAAIERVTVWWPGGEREVFAAPAAPGRFVATRGTAVLSPAPIARRMPAVDDAPLPPLPTSRAIVLRQPLLLPPTLAAALRGKPRRPVLLALWSQDCAACIAELQSLVRGRDAVAAADVDLMFLGAHAAADQIAASRRFRELTAAASSLRPRQRAATAEMQQAFAAILAAVAGTEELVTPTALLVDTELHIQVLYVGGVDVGILATDAPSYGRRLVDPTQRSRRRGRWAFAVERSYTSFLAALERRGLVRDAGFYAKLLSGRKPDKPPR